MTVFQHLHHRLDAIEGQFQGAPHLHPQSDPRNGETDKNPFYQEHSNEDEVKPNRFDVAYQRWIQPQSR